MTIKYIDAARQGKNKWWQYTLLLTIIPFVPVLCIYIILFICLHVFGNINFSDFENKVLLRKILLSMPHWAIYTLAISVYSSIFVSILIGIEKFHQRKFYSVICPDKKFDIKVYINSLALWLTISCLFIFLQHKLNFQNFQNIRLVFDPIQWFIYLIPLIISIITFALFTEIARGYILQGLGLIINKKYLLILTSGLLSSLFMLVINKSHSFHIQCILFDFIFGVGLAILILKENSLEIVLGIQTSVNLVQRFLIYQSLEESPSLPAIFSIKIDSPFSSSAENLAILVLLIKLSLFYGIFFRKSRD